MRFQRKYASEAAARAVAAELQHEGQAGVRVLRLGGGFWLVEWRQPETKKISGKPENRP